MSFSGEVSIHERFMELAIKQATIAIPIQSAYCVGSILVQYQPSNSSTNNDFDAYRIISSGYSRELAGNTHAEECCLMKYRELAEINSDIGEYNNQTHIRIACD
jgi:pyrimidine deaminase RibD-like protein